MALTVVGAVAFVVGLIMMFGGLQLGLLVALLGATAGIIGWVALRRLRKS